MDFEKELDICIRARFPLILLVTQEEVRAEDCIKSICERRERPCICWDTASGFQELTPSKKPPTKALKPLSALQVIEEQESEAVFILRDFHDCWDNAKVKRKLRSVSQQLKFTKKSIIVISPRSSIPTELRNESVVLEFPPPGEADLEKDLDKVLRAPGITLKLEDGEREKLIHAALGLTSAQALRVFAKAIVNDGILDASDIEVITSEKKQIIRESDSLEFYSGSETPGDVGGLLEIKEWLRLRERAFSKEARDYGLPAPKGIALIGIPGSGKSLTAKMIGNLWRLPLIRLDVGALFGAYVGESEEKARQALGLAEALSPCVMWIDEMEKALAHGGNDSGTSTRVFGTILTWMQEKTAPCFVVATANDISKLPPELLRRGRFDEIFFLDLPTEEEREAIFVVHLKKRNRKVESFDLDRLVQAAEGFVGAEIEQAIIDAMYIAFDESREFTTDDVVDAVKRLVPISISQRENIETLRKWLREGRARSASRLAEQIGEPIKAEELNT